MLEKGIKVKTASASHCVLKKVRNDHTVLMVPCVLEVNSRRNKSLNTFVPYRFNRIDILVVALNISIISA